MKPELTELLTVARGIACSADPLCPRHTNVGLDSSRIAGEYHGPKCNELAVAIADAMIWARDGSEVQTEKNRRLRSIPPLKKVKEQKGEDAQTFAATFLNDPTKTTEKFRL